MVVIDKTPIVEVILFFLICEKWNNSKLLQHYRYIKFLLMVQKFKFC